MRGTLKPESSTSSAAGRVYSAFQACHPEAGRSLFDLECRRAIRSSSSRAEPLRTTFDAGRREPNLLRARHQQVQLRPRFQDRCLVLLIPVSCNSANINHRPLFAVRFARQLGSKVDGISRNAFGRANKLLEWRYLRESNTH